MFTNYKGQQIYYQVVGKGKDLILLHGWKQEVSTWWPVIDLLKKDFKLWLIDLPGFGRSDTPDSAWSIKDYADCISGFIRKKRLNKPILLGHSLGGNVAIKLAAIHPKQLAKLVLEDSSGIRPKNYLRSGLFYFFAKLIKYLIPNIFNLREKIRMKFYQKIGSDYLDVGKLKSTLQNILNTDISNDAKKISVDTLIIWGEKDRVVPIFIGKKLYQLIKKSRFEMIDEVGHFPHLENPTLFSYYVKDFC